MNTPSSTHSSRQGFTLIELLVVIAIIAILAAMGFGVGATAIKKARSLTDTAAATGLSQAIDGYFDEYSSLPEVGAGGGNDDTKMESDSDLMNILMAFGTDGKKKNSKEIRYYSGRSAKGTTSARAYGGLFYQDDSVELFDAWKKFDDNKIRHYQVIMDTDYDDEIEDPFNSGKSVYNRKALVWSTGKDGEETPGKASDQKNRDNVYSWRN